MSDRDRVARVGEVYRRRLVDSAMPTECLACRHANEAGEQFCTACGSSLALKLCGACEAVNATGALACYQCGAPFTVESRRPPVPAVIASGDSARLPTDGSWARFSSRRARAMLAGITLLALGSWGYVGLGGRLPGDTAASRLFEWRRQPQHQGISGPQAVLPTPEKTAYEGETEALLPAPDTQARSSSARRAPPAPVAHTGASRREAAAQIPSAVRTAAPVRRSEAPSVQVSSAPVVGTLPRVTHTRGAPATAAVPATEPDSRQSTCDEAILALDLCAK